MADGSRPTLLDLVEFAATSLHVAKRPHVVVFMDQIPRDQAGNPPRAALATRLGLPAQHDGASHLERTYDAVQCWAHS